MGITLVRLGGSMDKFINIMFVFILGIMTGYAWAYYHFVILTGGGV